MHDDGTQGVTAPPNNGPSAPAQAHRLWNVLAGAALAVAAVLSLPPLYGSFGGEQESINWLTLALGTFMTGSLI